MTNPTNLSMPTKHREKRAVYKPARLILCSFVGVILCGTLFLMMPMSSNDGRSLAFLPALFTATSATCVTGLVMVDTYTQFTAFGQLIIILLIQIGGLGLVTLTSFFNIIIGRRMGFKSMRLASESVNLADSSQTRRLLRVIMTVAFSCEAVGALLLSFVFVPEYGMHGIFISFFLSISAFCNAGFDILGFISPYTSLTHYADNPFVLMVIASLIIAGGLGFLVWQDIGSYHKTRHLRLHTKTVLLLTASLLVIGTVGFALIEWNNPATLAHMNIPDKISNSLFQSVSARTAGFNSVPLAPMQNMTKFMMIFLMFIGAAPGGTGGGIKVTTIAILIAAVVSIISGRDDATLFKRHIQHHTVYKSLAIFFLSICAVMFSAITIFFNSGANVNEMDSMFEAVSAFATVGLSVGVTAIMGPLAQLITIFTMLIGRVGPVSMAISFAVTKPTSGYVVTPTADISVG